MAVYKDSKRKSWYVDLHYRDSNGIVKSKKKRGFETKIAAEIWEKSLKFAQTLVLNSYLEKWVICTSRLELELQMKQQFEIKRINSKNMLANYL